MLGNAYLAANDDQIAALIADGDFDEVLMSSMRNKPSRLDAELVEMADGLKRAGVIDATTHDEVRLRHSGSNHVEIAPVTQDEVRAMRERAHMSQAQFARRLNLTADYISQLERGAKHPAGAALALLDIIRRKGIEAIL